MNGFLRIAKLDLFTLKSQYTAYLSLVLIVVMFGFMGSSITLLGINVAWFIALMSSSIFAIQEKNNLDRLYGSVSVGLRDIVLGRYFFVFCNYLVSFLVVIVTHSGFMFFQNGVLALEMMDVLIGFSLSFLVFSCITGIQMPLFFKMGYTRAKILSFIPFIAVMALAVSPYFLPMLSGIVDFLQGNQNTLIIGGILASCMIQFFSYQAAVVAYRKRR